jgi:hypothetical protein
MPIPIDRCPKAKLLVARSHPAPPPGAGCRPGQFLSRATGIVAVALLAPLASAEEVVLENSAVRILVRDGRIRSLQDKERGLEHAAVGDALPGLFQIQWIKGIQPAGTLDASAMTARAGPRTAGEAEIAYDHPQAAVRVRITLSDTRGRMPPTSTAGG